MTMCLMLDVDGVPEKAFVDAFFRTAHWDDIITGRKDMLPTLAEILECIAPNVQAEDFVRYWFEMDSRIIEPVLADVRKARQRGITVFLATNQEHLRANYLMTDLGLREDLDGIVYSAQAGSMKPQHKFFQFAQKTTGRQPNSLLLVDDTMSNVEAALSLGGNAVHWDGSTDLTTLLQRSTSN